MIKTLIENVRGLRAAQADYMADRGNEELGRRVAAWATAVDASLAQMDPSMVEVFAAIESERRYQDKMAADPSRPDMVKDLGPGATILAISENVNRARAAWYTGDNTHPEAMGYLRKVAGLCVQLGQQIGMPWRGARS